MKRILYRLQSSFRLPFCIAGLVSMSTTAWFLNTFSPKQGIEIQIAAACLIVITSMLFLFSISKNIRRVSIISIGLLLFLFLRIFVLHDVLYYVLLLIFLFVLNAAVKKSTKNTHSSLY